MAPAETLFLLVFSHFLVDFGLQSSFIANGKDRTKPLPGVPWYHPMTAHCVMHGGGVYFATGSVTLGCLETVVHFAIDDSKCMGRFGWNADLALHLGCKVLWLALLINFPHLVP